MGDSIIHPLAGAVPQTVLPARALLNNGTVFFLDGVIDSSFAAADRLLRDTGVPFAFVDTAVVNRGRYIYAVTAFDVNSANSGPATQESVMRLMAVRPRVPATNEELPSITMDFTGDDGVPLDLAMPMPDIDSATGIFAGSMPPTDAFTMNLARVATRLLPATGVTIRIDSVVAVASSNIASGTQGFPSPECPLINPENGRAASEYGACWIMYLSIDRDGTISSDRLRGYTPFLPFPGPVELRLTAPFQLDEKALRNFQIPPGLEAEARVDFTITASNASSAADGDPFFRPIHGGSRWFDGDTEQGDNNTIADPARYRRVGSLSAVDTVFGVIGNSPADSGQPAPVAPREKACFLRAVSFLARQADVRFRWNGGRFEEVRDVTHNVNVRFSPVVGPTWGFLTDDANGNGFIDWQDFNYIEGAHQIIRNVDGSCDEFNSTRWDPANVFATVSLRNTPALVPTSTDGLVQAFGDPSNPLTQTGTGFGLYVNGERYIFETNILPPDGATWTLRTYQGTVFGFGATDPTGYTYLASDAFGLSTVRPALIEGLEFHYRVEAATEFAVASDTLLDRVHTVPDPYYVPSSQIEPPLLRFVNLPDRVAIRIYSTSGILVKVIDHYDPFGGGAGGTAEWDLRTRNGDRLASGVYSWHIETPEGNEKVGRFTIVNGSGRALP